MGAMVIDFDLRKQTLRCPEANPPGAVNIKITKDLDGDEDVEFLSLADHNTLLADAATSESAFDSSASTIMGDFYDDLREVVVVGSKTFNEKTECWKCFKDEIT